MVKTITSRLQEFLDEHHDDEIISINGKPMPSTWDDIHELIAETNGEIVVRIRDIGGNVGEVTLSLERKLPGLTS